MIFEIEVGDLVEGDFIKFEGWDNFYELTDIGSTNLDGVAHRVLTCDVSEYADKSKMETEYYHYDCPVQVRINGHVTVGTNGKLIRNWVNVYSINREYGGPEEGGWWVDCGEPVISIPCEDHASAYDVREKMAEEYPNTGKRYSVLGGEDYNVMIEPEPGKSFPEVFPHYE